MYSEAPYKNVPYAFVRGPIVYCTDMVCNKQIGNDDSGLVKDLQTNVDTLPTRVACTSPLTLGPMYEADALYKGSVVKLNHVPIANIGQWFVQARQNLKNSPLRFHTEYGFTKNGVQTVAFEGCSHFFRNK
jgi:hypothetical protein